MVDGSVETPGAGGPLGDALGDVLAVGVALELALGNRVGRPPPEGDGEAEVVGEADELALVDGDGLVVVASWHTKPVDRVDAVPAGRGDRTLTTVKVGEHSGVEVLPSGEETC